MALASNPGLSLQPNTERDRAGSELSRSSQGSFAAAGKAGNSASLLHGECPTALSVRQTPWRFVVLLAIAGFMFGNFYFFDQTSATEDAVRRQTGMSEDTFGVLSSVYSWPNVVLPLIGGFLIDKLGVRTSSLIFCSLTLAGSCLFTLGLWVKSSTILIISRVIFGAGGESQNICCLAFVVKWFKETNLAFATAIAIAVSRIGSVCAFDTQGPLVDKFGVTVASAVGSVICFVSLLSAIWAVVMDIRSDRKDAAQGLTVGHESQDENIQLADITKFGKMYTLLTISLVMTYVSAFPFLQVVSAGYLKARFSFGESKADQIAGAVNLTSAVLSPILGIIVDRCGRRPILLTLSSGAFVAANIGFIVFPTYEDPDFMVVAGVVCLYVFMGIGLSVYGSVIWPCVPLVVDERTVGTAYGLATALQNLGMAVSPMIITNLHSSTGEWTSSFLYILACVGTGFVAGMAVWVIDLRRDRRLMLPKLPERE